VTVGAVEAGAMDVDAIDEGAGDPPVTRNRRLEEELDMGARWNAK